MTPRRCDRNTSELPQRGQSRLDSAFISNAPYYFPTDQSDHFAFFHVEAYVFQNPDVGRPAGRVLVPIRVRTGARTRAMGASAWIVIRAQKEDRRA